MPVVASSTPSVNQYNSNINSNISNNSQHYDENIFEDNEISPTTRIFHRTTALDDALSMTSGGSAERRPQNSIVPRLRHALSNVHLPGLTGGRKKSGSRDNSVSDPSSPKRRLTGTSDDLSTTTSNLAVSPNSTMTGSNSYYESNSSTAGGGGGLTTMFSNNGNANALLDVRRPSYASQTTTRSSTSHRGSLTENESSGSPMYGSLSLPQSLDPSELSLITNLPNANVFPGDSQHRGISYPDPVSII